MINKYKITKNFSKAAHTYHDHAIIQKHVAEKLINIIPALSTDAPNTILEIGCGTGFLTQLLHTHYPHAHITATDISSEMILQAQNLFPNQADLIEFACHDGEHYPFTDSFDLIASNMTFQWFQSLESTLMTYQEHLKKKGYIAFSTLMGDSFYEWYESLLLAGAETISPIKSDPLPNHFTYKTVERFTLREDYHDGYALLRHIKAIGAHSGANNKPLKKATLDKACQIFSEQFNNMITYDVILAIL